MVARWVLSVVRCDFFVLWTKLAQALLTKLCKATCTLKTHTLTIALHTQVTDGKDRRTLMVLLERFYSTEVLRGGVSLQTTPPLSASQVSVR